MDHVWRGDESSEELRRFDSQYLTLFRVLGLSAY
jgi:hypothetical protein